MNLLGGAKPLVACTIGLDSCLRNKPIQHVVYAGALGRVKSNPLSCASLL